MQGRDDTTSVWEDYKALKCIQTFKMATFFEESSIDFCSKDTPALNPLPLPFPCMPNASVEFFTKMEVSSKSLGRNIRRLLLMQEQCYKIYLSWTKKWKRTPLKGHRTS